MAATSWDPLQPRINYKAGQVPHIVYGGTEEASQTFKAGCLVQWDTSTGEVQEVAAASGGAVTATVVCGIVQKDATGTAGAAMPVELIDPSDEVIIRLTTNGTDALASTFLPGQNYALYVDADQVFYADSNVTNQDMVTFIAPVYDVNGDVGYTGRIKFLASVCQSHVGY